MMLQGSCPSGQDDPEATMSSPNAFLGDALSVHFGCSLLAFGYDVGSLTTAIRLDLSLNLLLFVSCFPLNFRFTWIADDVTRRLTADTAMLLFDVRCLRAH